MNELFVNDVYVYIQEMWFTLEIELLMYISIYIENENNKSPVAARNEFNFLVTIVKLMC